MSMLAVSMQEQATRSARERATRSYSVAGVDKRSILGCSTVNKSELEYTGR